MRRCFLTPIPEIEICADLLSKAAEAILCRDQPAADRLVREADIPAICEFTLTIIGKIDPAIHYQSVNPRPSKATKAKARMPSTAI